LKIYTVVGIPQLEKRKKGVFFPKSQGSLFFIFFEKSFIVGKEGRELLEKILSGNKFQLDWVDWAMQQRNYPSSLIISQSDRIKEIRPQNKALTSSGQSPTNVQCPPAVPQSGSFNHNLF
jgi:hypothetical protein